MLLAFFLPYLHVYSQAHGEFLYLEAVDPGASLGEVMTLPLARRYRPESTIVSYSIGAILQGELSRFFWLLNQQFLPLAMFLGALGLRALLDRRTADVVFVLFAGLASWILVLLFNASDKHIYYLPAYLVFAVAVGVGLDSVRRTTRLAVTTGTVIGVLALLALNVPAAYARMYVAPEGNVFNHDDLIAAAGADATVITRAENRDYHGRLVETFYELTQGLESRGLDFVALDEVIGERLYITGRALVGRDLGFMRELAARGVDFELRSSRGSLAELLAGLPPRATVLVAGAVPASGPRRRELAEALAAAGLGLALVQQEGTAYAGVGWAGSEEPGVEVLDARAATLRLPGDLPDGLAGRLAEEIRILAESSDTGGAGYITMGGQELGRPAPMIAEGRNASGLHLVALSPDNGSVIARGHVEVDRTLLLSPYHFTTRDLGTPPVTLSFDPRARAQLVVTYADGRIRRHAFDDAVSVAVADPLDRRMKAVLRFAADDAGAEWALPKVRERLQPGDLVVLAVSDSRGAALEAARGLLESIGVDPALLRNGEWTTVVAFGSVATSGQAIVQIDPDSVLALELTAGLLVDSTDRLE